MALDQAYIDIVGHARGNESLMQRIERQRGIHTLEHAEAIGLGSRGDTLVDIGGWPSFMPPPAWNQKGKTR